jgi:hypothetical protein
MDGPGIAYRLDRPEAHPVPCTTLFQYKICYFNKTDVSLNTSHCHEGDLFTIKASEKFSIQPQQSTCINVYWIMLPARGVALSEYRVENWVLVTVCLSVLFK